MSCSKVLSKGSLIPIALALHAYHNRYRANVSPMETHLFRIGVALG